MVRRHVIVRGSVQGVFFRSDCRDEASRHGVSGWIANRSDGAVEAVFEGQPDAVDAMTAWVRHGSRHASVDSVEVSDEDPTGESGFAVK